uniref:KPN_02809 family neutral zinc metallopeptidase n=1 Tax=Paenirhodobacter enshiensis TaxID=1105367 RepID=UPI0035B14564
MKWQGRRGSDNIEDRRGQGGGGGLRLGGAGGLGVLAIVVAGWVFGVDLTPLLSGLDEAQAPASRSQLTDRQRAAGEFVSVTLADTEEVWTEVFRDQLGRSYRPAKLVLFSQVYPSACGSASAATGPFYCPSDGKVYLDTAFFDTLSRQLGAGGDFAAAYVIAHEIGHHVQDELGILSKANDLRSRMSEADSNAISVRIELQADCFAGVWANHAAAQFQSLEPGDIDEALNAAAHIGDNTLQRNAGRVPMPDSFTHGTSAQRARWFANGYRGGKVASCDTFSARSL